MNWFERHLNWTWILSIILGLIIMFSFEEIAKPNYYDNTYSFAEFISVPFIIVWGLCFSIWYLRKKKLPLWFLMLLFFVPAFPPLGIWLFLRLPNRNLLVNEKTCEK